jgi:predicted dinucleotide-binding enzyme
MKLRSLVLFGAGIMTGLAIARRLTQDDPEVLHGPTRSDPSSSSPALRAVTSQAQRLADRATVASLGAIRRARGAIRDRMTEEPYDDVNWN